MFVLESKQARAAAGEERAVRGDKKGAAQYTLAAGKQTQNIDYIIFTDTQSSLRLMFT